MTAKNRMLGTTHLSHDQYTIVANYLRTPGLTTQTKAGKTRCTISDQTVADRLNAMYAGTKTFDRPLTRGQVARVRNDLFGKSRDKVAPKPEPAPEVAPAVNKMIKLPLTPPEPAPAPTPDPGPVTQAPATNADTVGSICSRLDTLTNDLAALQRDFSEHRATVANNFDTILKAVQVNNKLVLAVAKEWKIVQ
jgi:hypothetical protein